MSVSEKIRKGVEQGSWIRKMFEEGTALKKQYGDKLSFDGTIGIQTTMPFGTTDDVDREVKRMIETVGEGGGLIIAPTHVLEPEVPLENIMAFLNAVDRYGHYV